MTRWLCFIFCCMLLVASNIQSITAANLSTLPKRRFVVYLTGQHNIVPELHLVSRVTHVALAFIRSEVFNIPDQQEWPLFTTVAEVRPKFANDTKVQVAIGGWGNTEGFSIAARTAANRKLFAANVKAMINATGADGVDIDFEYPGGNGEDYKQIPNTEKIWEIEAYPKLLAEIRAAIGPSKLLTAAVPGLKRDMMAFTQSTVPKINETVDFLNVMTYDLMNRRDNVTKHHSGVQDSIVALSAYADPGMWLKDLNAGLGFYIKWFKTASNEICDRVPAIGCRTELMENPVTGADLGKAGAFSWHDEVPSELAASFERAMKYGVDDGHDDFQGHYYMDQKERIFWSWDTPESIKWKLRRFSRVWEGDKDHRDIVGGVFAWGLGEDAPHFEHLEAVNDVLAEWDDGDHVVEHEEL